MINSYKVSIDVRRGEGTLFCASIERSESEGVCIRRVASHDKGAVAIEEGYN